VRACAPALADARLPSALLLARFSVLAMGDAEGDQSEATTVPDGSRSDGSASAGRVAGGELVVRSGAAASEAAAGEAVAEAVAEAVPPWSTLLDAVLPALAALLEACVRALCGGVVAVPTPPAVLNNSNSNSGGGGGGGSLRGALRERAEEWLASREQPGSERGPHAAAALSSAASLCSATTASLLNHAATAAAPHLAASFSPQLAASFSSLVGSTTASLMRGSAPATGARRSDCGSQRGGCG